VKSIEHGHLAETIRLTGERGAWLSTQPFKPGDELLTPANLEKKQKRWSEDGNKFSAGPENAT